MTPVLSFRSGKIPDTYMRMHEYQMRPWWRTSSTTDVFPILPKQTLGAGGGISLGVPREQTSQPPTWIESMAAGQPFTAHE